MFFGRSFAFVPSPFMSNPAMGLSRMTPYGMGGMPSMTSPFGGGGSDQFAMSAEAREEMLMEQMMMAMQLGMLLGRMMSGGGGCGMPGMPGMGVPGGMAPMGQGGGCGMPGLGQMGMGGGYGFPGMPGMGSMGQGGYGMPAMPNLPQMGQGGYGMPAMPNLPQMGQGGFGLPGMQGPAPYSPPMSQPYTGGAPNTTMGPLEGGGSQAVSLARQYLGQNSINLRGQLPNFQAAGGQTNDCADFVSSVLQDTGGLQGHYVGVSALRNALLQQGYHQVSKAQAQPGDVWISSSVGHTELVAAPGGSTLIGSNNDRPGHQRVSTSGAGSGTYYSRS